MHALIGYMEVYFRFYTLKCFWVLLFLTVSGYSSDAVSIELTVAEKQWLDSRSNITLGFVEGIEPLLILDTNNNLTGVIVDVYSLISNKIAKDITIEIGPTFGDLTKKITAGEIDGLAAGARQGALKRNLISTKTIARSYNVIYSKKGSGFIAKNKQDLVGKRVGVVKDIVTTRMFIESLTDSSTIVYTDNAYEALQLLYTRKIDALVGLSSFDYLILKYQLSGIQASFVDWADPTDLTPSIRPELPELVSILNKAIDLIDEKEFNEIWSKWNIPIPAKNKMNLILTADERQWLKTHHVIKVGSDNDIRPVEFRNAQGDFEGISIEYLRMFEKKLGIQFDIQSDPSWKKLLIKTRDRELDMLTGVAPTIQRKEYLLFTDPYITFPSVIFTQSNAPYVGSLKNLKNKKVAVVDGFAIHTLIAQNFPNIQLVPVASMEHAFELLARDEVFAYAGGLLPNSFYLTQNSLTHFKVSGDTPHEIKLTFGIRSDWPELAVILQKTLKVLTNEEKSRIFTKWVPLTYEHTVDYSLFWKLGVAVAFAFLLFILWNWQLAGKVRSKTAELKQSYRELKTETDKRIAAIKELSEKEKQLQQSLKNEAIGQLAGGIAHDFNNMLGGIMGGMQLLDKLLPGSEKSKKYVSLINKSVERAADLSNKLLQFSRRQSIASTAIDVHVVVNETVAILKNTIDKRILIETNLSAESNNVIGDPTQLQSVFLNLSINASHAMESGGVLRIDTQCKDLSVDDCASSSFDLTAGQFIEIVISDTGTGIPQDDVEKIFEPYFTTKEPGKGTGLGLAAVYGSIRQHNGAVSVWSELGKGTVFTILLPVNTEPVSTLQKKEELQVHGKGTILLVDDEEVMRITGRALLKGFGYTVLLAKDGKEAVNIFLQQNTQIDLVIIDMIMPVMNGRDCFMELKKIQADVPVVLASGFTRAEDLHELKHAGLAGHIKKPFSGTELSQVVAKALH